MASKAETDFIDQYTRRLMVELCKAQVTYGDPFKGLDSSSIQHFIEHAVAKKWLAKDRSRVLAAGWATAARFLKR